MAKREVPLHYLQSYLPNGTAEAVLSWLNRYKVHLTITRERKTVLGDYRHASGNATHRISVNGNLNKFAFLITLVHELAHLVTFMQYGHRVAAHGREWKNLYALLLKDFLDAHVFPPDIEETLRSSLHNLPASSCADEGLVRILRRYDGNTDGMLLVEEIAEGSIFEIGGGRLFRRGKKLRKRYQCVEIHTGKLYLFSPVYEVKAV
ncbi:MAG TPA: SprT-like domain-containing protein [Chitinophagaceae bacterium]|nr:SprT-like domain-containing protein [Chitinophagaceae bacterium]